MASCMEFVLHHQSSGSTDMLDTHLDGIMNNPKARPTAIELLESLADLAQGTQAIRATLMISLAARVVVKSDLSLEDIELRLPQGLQLSLLLHVRNLVRELDPGNRAEWECHIHRWLLRSIVRGEDPSQGARQMPGAPANEGDIEDVRNPESAANHLTSFLSQQTSVASSTGPSENEGQNLALVCVISHDLAEWHLHRGELKRAEELFRMSLAITHRLELSSSASTTAGHVSKTGRRCTVRPERLAALALALRMLRLSQPDAPSTPHLARYARKQQHLGADAVADTDDASGEIRISPAVVMLLTAELLRLAGQQAQLIQLLHLDNVLRLSRWLAHLRGRAEGRGVASGGGLDSACSLWLQPLPWAYREHVCEWVLETAEPSARVALWQQAAAANSLATLTPARAMPTVLSLKMMQGMQGVPSAAAVLPAHTPLPAHLPPGPSAWPSGGAGTSCVGSRYSVCLLC